MKKVFLIGEIGINHNDDIEIAKQLIQQAKGCGWDAVKFQKRTIDIVYSKKFLESHRESPWGTTQRAQKQVLEFGHNEYSKINYFCKMNHIPWFASAWDFGSLRFLEQFDVPYHKIASPMLTSLEFVEAVAKIGKKTFISTGGSRMADILNAHAIFQKYDTEFILMHCVSIYPCPDEDCNIQFVQTLKGAFPRCEIGYSGHEIGIQPTLTAVAFGATYIERHITLDRSMYGSDQAASLERKGMVKIREYADQIQKCIGKGGKQILEQEAKTMEKLRWWK